MAELKTYTRYPEDFHHDDPPPTYDNAAFTGDSTQDVNGIQHPQPTDTRSIPMPPSENCTPAPDHASAAEKGNVQGEEGGEEGEEEEEEDSGTSNKCSEVVGIVQDAIYGFFTTNEDLLWKLLYLLLLLLYLAYFIGAMVYKFGDEGSIRLLVVTCVVALYLVFRLFEFLYRRGNLPCLNCSNSSGSSSVGCWSKFLKVARKLRLYIVLTVGVILFAIIYVVVEIGRHKPRNMISLGGMAAFILLFYIFSSNPAKVKWRPVIWGILLQFIFALIILRTTWGFQAFDYLGKRVTEFLAYTDAGSKFVFGDLYENHFFAFKVLPVVVFFSTFVTMMYYVGFMQFVIRNVGRFLAFCLGTSPAESLNAAGNIFLGQSESPLMIRPFIQDMTLSELHAVLTGGFATIAGSVMAAYILYGVPPNHLLSASVMSAPAALAMSKLFYPETQKVKHTKEEVYNLKKGTERNIIEAASNGATQSVKLVANIAVNLIAFVALLDFVNSTLIWFGERVGMHDPKLTFQLICSYVFYPLSFLMGVDGSDVFKLGELIGTKTFLNEFYAYTELAVYIKNRKNFEDYQMNYTLGLPTHPTGYWEYLGDDIYLKDIKMTLIGGLMSERSVVIATYALCGFSNLTSMGLMLGALGGMAPSRRSDISGLVFRAMIAGNVACFMTACIAGLLST
ncbi:putative transporter HI_0519 [Babylonia areolata]|uniref:putative transporter HI_0519 n=1 Tax=Babylonia areolata TaxID=304850 RepID=UPI003FD5D48D